MSSTVPQADSSRRARMAVSVWVAIVRHLVGFMEGQSRPKAKGGLGSTSECASDQAAAVRRRPDGVLMRQEGEAVAATASKRSTPCAP